MTALVLAVLVASLLGSTHCVGMCGAFLALSVDSDRRTRAQIAYHLGRLATYTGLGALAGGLGSAMDATGTLAGLERPAAIAASVMVCAFGLATLLRSLGVRVPRAPLPAWLRHRVALAQRAALALPAARRALAIGLLTPMLPCGWLYAFVITSAGTGSALWGATTMASFWLGTVPALGIFGAGLAAISGTLRRRAPIATSMLVVVVGVMTIAHRLASGAPARASLEPRSSAELAREVRAFDAADCCADEEPER